MAKSRLDPSKLLAMLPTASQRRFISAQELATSSGSSKTVVLDAIQALRSFGYRIENRRGQGYRIEAKTDNPVPWELQKILRTRYLGKEKILYLKSCDSTQSIALESAERDAKGSLVVIAQRQTNSVGRNRRKWFSPEGGLWLSVAIRPRIPVALSTLLPLAAAIAVCKAIEKVTGLQPDLKWPNDVMISGKKIAGILVDSSILGNLLSYAIIGIGINVNFHAAVVNHKFRAADAIRPTSLFDELGKRTSCLLLTARLLEELERYCSVLEDRQWSRKGPKQVIDTWKSRSSMLGNGIKVTIGAERKEGIAVGISDQGALLLKSKDGSLTEITSGTVTVRPA